MYYLTFGIENILLILEHYHCLFFYNPSTNKQVNSDNISTDTYSNYINLICLEGDEIKGCHLELHYEKNHKKKK